MNLKSYTFLFLYFFITGKNRNKQVKFLFLNGEKKSKQNNFF